MCLRVCFSVCVFLLVSTASFAEESIRVHRWFAGGTKSCNKNDIQMIENGNAISFLFTNFKVELREAERRDGYADVAVCVLVVILEVPSGMCLSDLDQTVSGGVLKSRESQGRFEFFSWLNGAPAAFERIRWSRGDEILPEDTDSLFTVSTRNPSVCLRSRFQTFVSQVTLFASRRHRSESFLGVLDSIDGDVTLRVRVR